MDSRQRFGLKEIAVLFMLFVPPLVCYSMLQLTNDAIACILTSIMLAFYGLPLFAEQVLNIYSFDNAAHRESDKLLKAIKQVWPVYCMSGIIIGLILAFLTFIMPDGPASITLPFPTCPGWLRLIYWAGFSWFFVLWLPLAEEYFYRLFGMHYFRSNWSFVIVAIAGTCSNLAVLLHTVDGTNSIIGASILCFLGSTFLTWLKKRTKLINTIILKSAFHLGFDLWLLYLSWMHTDSMRFPNAFLNNNPANIFSQ